ncbi:PIF1-like protein [Mya arenaria]|uniref:PIF1-like protein n=1 Tax=Mya arenaria TaxID=6604 RepID=A0ABY7G916_MYAAR|nr:PIF1-like protein [Mya arenaria]
MDMPLEPVNSQLDSQAPAPQTFSVPVETEPQHQDIFYGLNPSSVMMGYIDIQVLDYYSALLKAQCAQTHGLIPPSVLYQQQLSNENIHTGQIVPEGVDAVQIHFINDHYLVSAKQNDTITVFDSLKNTNRVQRLIPQLRRIYGDLGKLSIKYIVPQSQGTSDDCGVFAAANAYFLVNGESLYHLILDQDALRNHLKLCLQNGTITDFPKEKETFRSDSLKSYFDDQAKRKLQKQTQLLNNSKNTNVCVQLIATSKQAEKQRRWRHKQRELDIDCARQKRAYEQRKARQKQRQHDINKARHKRSDEQSKVRQKHRDRNLNEARNKRNDEQNKVRQKHRDRNLNEARNKRNDEQNKVRQKHRDRNLNEARNKRNDEQNKVRQKHRDRNLNEARNKRNDEQNKVRQKHREHDGNETRRKQTVEKRKVRHKHREQDANETRRKQTVEKTKVRQKHREQDANETRRKQTVEKSKVRHKHREQNLYEAKRKRSDEQCKVRHKHREQNLYEAKRKRSDEQCKVRHKHREQNLYEARRKRSDEQCKVRQKHREQNLYEARRKRSDEQCKVRQKQMTANPQKAKKKRAQEQQNYRKKEFDLQKASVKFTKNINQYPEYVCTCCSRMLYKRSVVCVDNVSFKRASSDLLAQCLSINDTAEGKRWLCQTCLRYIRQNKMPPQSDANNLKLPSIPEDLQDLSTLEERLLSQRYPFMKLLALPKGRQNAIKGAVVNIPVEVNTVAENLPRTPLEAGLVPLKLKRKVEYKGHYSFQYIRPEKILGALHWLMQNNVLYSTIQLKHTWVDECVEEDVDTWNELTGNVPEGEATEGTLVEEENDNDTVEEDSTNESDTEEITPISEDPSHNVQFETCVQPTDLSLDASRIVSIAPGEGKRPLAILGDENFEELCFPTLFPSGKFGYKYQRPVQLSVKKYFQRRILEKGGHFASNIEYLFVAQFLSEWHQILSCMSIALRKSKSGHDGETFNAGFFKNRDMIRPLLTKDDAYRFLQPIRGSPPYWQKVMFELLAAVKQFKIFTWFLTLSAADMRWEDTLKALAKQQGRTLSNEEIREMTWEERCSLLRSNPTTAARHFHHRLQCLFTDVILSPACPLGKISRYFYRIEFQQRGSPHAHAILWVEDAPHPNDSSEDICTFVDSYIKANMPKDNEELTNLVKDVQTHRHTATCSKRGDACRFSFPKPVSDRIILSRPDHDENEKEKRKTAIEILTKVKDCLQEDDYDNDNLNVNDLLQKCNVTSDVYYEALQNATKTPTVFMKRDPCETCINNFNPDILWLWKANTDLQYVTSPYAAIAYITSYITKDEREVGTVLQAVSKETRNLQVNEQMKKVAFAFSNARTVSAQEAAYRVLGLPLYVSNFTTVWIPSGLPENRIRILKSKQQLNALDDDDENVFSTNIIDRYAARPSDLKQMCLAEFAMWYGLQKKDTKQDDNDHFQVLSDPTFEKQPPNLSKNHPQSLPSKSPGSLSDHKPSEHSCCTPEVTTCSKCDQQPSHSFDESADNIHKSSTHYTSCDQTSQSPCNMSDVESDQSNSDTYDALPSSESDYYIRPSTNTNKEPYLVVDQSLDTCVNSQSVKQKNIDSTTQPTRETIVLKGLGTMKRRMSPAVIRYHQCSQSKDLQLFCYNRMLLFMPWSDETEDLLGGFGTYSEHYESKKNDIEDRFRQIMKNEELVQEALSQFQEYGPPRHAWDEIAPETEHTEADLIEEGYGSDENFAIQDPDANENATFTPANQPVGDVLRSVLEVNPDLLNETEYRKLVQSLNYQQRIVFQHLLSWTSNVDEPQHIFITGGAGTGKSHLISAIYNMINRELRKPGEDPTKPKILLMAPTGTAAFNIGEMGQPIVVLTRGEKRPSSLKDYTVSERTTETGGISKTLELSKNARIMIIRNIDVQDGLVNGAQGTIVDFFPNSTKVHAVLVRFDKPNIGAAARASSSMDLSSYSQDVVPIKRVDVSFSTSSNRSSLQITWSQFPLKLSFACTIHKVQGLSVDELVVSFEKKFGAGQAYVALSRCRSLEGLQLLNFDSKKITQSTSVQKEMTRLQETMLLPSPYSCLQDPVTCEIFTVSLLNARSLRLHFPDVIADPICNLSDMLMFTETHLYTNETPRHTIPGYSSVLAAQDTHKNYHGLACYFKEEFRCQRIVLPEVEHIETLGVRLHHDASSALDLILIYRSPSVSYLELLFELEIVLHTIENAQKTVFLGDFNVDALVPDYQPLQSLMEKYSFTFRQPKASHTLGSCLDHIYLPREIQSRYNSCTYIPTYFSDHYYAITTLEKPQ